MSSQPLRPAKADGRSSECFEICTTARATRRAIAVGYRALVAVEDYCLLRRRDPHLPALTPASRGPGSRIPLEPDAYGGGLPPTVGMPTPTAGIPSRCSSENPLLCRMRPE